MGGSKIVSTGDNFSRVFLCKTAKMQLLLGFVKCIRKKIKSQKWKNFEQKVRAETTERQGH